MKKIQLKYKIMLFIIVLISALIIYFYCISTLIDLIVGKVN